MTSAATIPRLTELQAERGDAPPANIPGFWIIAGTPVAEPYPCTCWYAPCRYEKCTDRLRTEGELLPEGCCGRDAAPVAEPGFLRPPRQTSQEPSEPATHTRVPTEGSSGADGGRRQARGASRCECRTPWDPPPPVLLIAATRQGPVRTTVHLAERPDDVRADGDAAINDLGRRRTGPWKDGRHVLLPPPIGARGKTRPCWHAQLDDGTLAVLDTPDETGSGVHCPDCHQNFHNAGAWQSHRGRVEGQRWREVCRDPATVLVVENVWIKAATGGQSSAIEHVTYGVPLLKRGVAGVWQTDPLAVWGAKGPPMDRDEASTIWTRAQERLAADRWRFGRGMNRGKR